MSGWRPSLGAVCHAGGVRFRAWAPKPAEIAVVLLESGGERVLPMRRDGEYVVLDVPGIGHRQRYRFRADGVDIPDPCSRSQPEGVHGPSEVIDPARFAWTDSAWSPPAFADLVIYECHIGTFTPEGTFESAIRELPRLAELGITAVELMPVASWPGRWNWGYDGVALFAPAAPYGGPEGLRRFIDAAHAAGLAVILDVVYNHFGPDGNYTGVLSTHYITDRYQTPWGGAVNFDDAGSRGVREFVVENLLHWVHEYHADGFRLDATHEIRDASPRHILAEVRDATAAHARSGHVPYLIAETHENDTRYLRPTSGGGFGFDAVWADDFHHGVRTLIHHENEGYLAGFAGTAAELARTISRGWLYEGQADPSGHHRGTPAEGLDWRNFLYCIQNHDQVGNRALGLRLNSTAAMGDFRVASALLLLLPQTPMLFQGQEFAASTPFLYFTDHNPDLGRLVTEGRRNEFAAFSAFSDPHVRDEISDPQAESTFRNSQLRLDERTRGIGRLVENLYRELLRLRRDDPVLRAMRHSRPPMVARALSDEALVVDMHPSAGRRLLVANFGGALAFEEAAAITLEPLLNTDDARFGGFGRKPQRTPSGWIIPEHSAVLFG